MQANGIQTVDWNTISNHEFYKDNADKPEDKKERGGNVWMMSNANSGNSIYSGSTAFAFGKAKKATAFSEDLGAPVAYFNLIVDFADILLNVDIKTSGGRGYNLTGYPITKTKQFKEAKKIDGFTSAQRFFLSWAQIWRNNALPETQAQLILTDSHSPGMYRTNGAIVNIDGWYSAFNVQPGDKLYIAPEKRIRIW